MDIEEIQLQMNKFVKLTEEYENLNDLVDQISKASIDVLEYENAEVSAELVINIDTKEELNDDPNGMSPDMEPEELLEKMLKRSKSKKEIRTKKHKIELNNMSHVMSLALMTYLIDRMKESKITISKNINKIGKSINWNEENNSK